MRSALRHEPHWLTSGDLRGTNKGDSVHLSSPERLLGVPAGLAAELIHAVSVRIGTEATLLATPKEARDPQLASSARGAVMNAILGDVRNRQGRVALASLAIARGTRLDEVEAITPGERLLLSELLGRLSSAV